MPQRQQNNAVTSFLGNLKDCSPRGLSLSRFPGAAIKVPWEDTDAALVKPSVMNLGRYFPSVKEDKTVMSWGCCKFKRLAK